MRWMIGIAALAEHRVIGNAGKIPWYLPEDFKHFKATTMGQVLVMGRRTYESIGRPLPGRRTLVVSQRPEPIEGVEVVPTLEQLHTADFETEVFLCGGGMLYRAGLKYCRALILTHVHAAYPGDVFFPEYEAEFKESERLLERPGFSVVRYEATDA